MERKERETFVRNGKTFFLRLLLFLFATKGLYAKRTIFVCIRLGAALELLKYSRIHVAHPAKFSSTFSLSKQIFFKYRYALFFEEQRPLKGDDHRGISLHPSAS